MPNKSNKTKTTTSTTSTKVSGYFRNNPGGGKRVYVRPQVRHIKKTK